jgi:hypothetical protein
MRSLSVLVLIASACTQSRSPPIPAAEDSFKQSHESVRLVLERHCGTCHRADLPTAQPVALAVFAINEPDWSARMSEAQLRSALYRIQNLVEIDGASFERDLRSSGGQAGGNDLQLVQQYVDQLLARRAIPKPEGKCS